MGTETGEGEATSGFECVLRFLQQMVGGFSSVWERAADPDTFFCPSAPERLAVFHSFFDDWRVCVRFSDEFSRIASDSPPVISARHRKKARYPPVISGTLEFPPVIRRRGRSANKRESRFSSRIRRPLLERFSGGRFRDPFLH